jgi:hypothetical protein
MTDKSVSSPDPSAGTVSVPDNPSPGMWRKALGTDTNLSMLVLPTLDL